MKLVKTETLEMREMFERYYMMGPERSVRKIAKEFNKADTTVKRYAKSFNWVERVQQRDLAVADDLERKTMDVMVNSKARYREVIRELTDQFVKDVAAGKIKIRSTKAFVELVQLDLELMGDDTGNEGTDNMAALVDSLNAFRASQEGGGNGNGGGE